MEIYLAGKMINFNMKKLCNAVRTALGEDEKFKLYDLKDMY
jgi:hypothetical protein